MITCKFVGELGNNLFQLATLLNIHVTMNIDYCIPNHRIYWNDKNINTLEFPKLFNYEFNYNNIDLQNYIHFDRLPTNDSKYTHLLITIPFLGETDTRSNDKSEIVLGTIATTPDVIKFKMCRPIILFDWIRLPI